MKSSKDKIFGLVLAVLVAFSGYTYYKLDQIEQRLDYEGYKEVSDMYAKKLSLKSAYGDTQAYHPKVISFEEKWNGYKYWMAFSPYPNADSSKENPHVVVSNDMINWERLDNYLLDEPDDFAGGKRYNSDPHLVYNSDKNILECYWRYVDDKDDKVIIYRRTTKDGINWTKKEVILQETRSKKDYVSPAIIYEDGIYKLWYVNEVKVHYMESKDLKNWSKPVTLDIEFSEGVKAWHIDVIHTEKGYEMIIVAFTDWEHRMYMNLYYTYSTDNKSWSVADTILTPATGTNKWYNSGLYRSSILYEDGKYYVYFSGQGVNNAKGTGLMSGTDIFKLEPEF